MRPLDSAVAARFRSTATRALTAVNVGLAIGFAFGIYRNLVQPSAVIASDFTVFWTGWTIILSGQASALYDEVAQRTTQELLMYGMHFEGGLMAFLNPPHAALVSTPVGWLANRVGEHRAFLVWTAANVALLVVLVRSLADQWSTTARQQRWMLIIAVAAFYPAFCAVKNGQTSILLALAVLGVYQAADAGRHWRGGAWLVVLTIKPQLLPMVVIYLAVRRCWPLLACAGAMMAGVVVVTAAVLGPAIWLAYLHQVRVLEHFWGSGTPDYMVNVRGALSRLFGLERHQMIESASYAVWFGAMLFVALALVRRRIDRADDPRAAFALAIAAAVLSSPHLFLHDAIIWTIPLVFYAAALRDSGCTWRPFAHFALAWPLLFAWASSLNIKSGHLAWLDPYTWTLVAATAIIACPVAVWRSDPLRPLRSPIAALASADIP
jgi:hypothetical protein